jgi:hypothetical protein
MREDWAPVVGEQSYREARGTGGQPRGQPLEEVQRAAGQRELQQCTAPLGPLSFWMGSSVRRGPSGSVYS